MVRWFKLYKNQYLGIFFLGIGLFALQELPYMIMPFLSLKSNPIMNLSNHLPFLNLVQSILGSIMIAVLILVVRKDSSWFSIQNTKEKIYFSIAIMLLAFNYLGWILYFLGYQTISIQLIFLVAAVPLYYLFLGLWRRNEVLVIISALFFVIHFTNVACNLL